MKPKFKGLLAALAAAALCGCASQSLERSQPEAENVDPAAIESFVTSLERKMMGSGDTLYGNANAFVLLKNGKVIAEGAWAPFRLDARRQIFSMSKSFTAIAIGFAVQENLLSIDDPVIGFFPDKQPALLSANLASMRVRDLLTMQSGHEKDTIGGMFEAGDMVSGFFAQEVKFQPGTHFLYNNGATYMLSAIITQVTGQSLADYLTPRLFAPLGIGNIHWEADKDGINFGAWGLYLNLEEMAKFAQFCLNKGVWNGESLLNPEWIETAASPLCNVGTGEPTDWNQGYGFQFWCCRNNAYRAAGYLGQCAIIMPSENAVLVMFCSTNREKPPLDSVWEELLPALRGGKRIGTSVSEAQLREKLAKLTLELPETKLPSKLLAPGSSVNLILPEGNQFKINTIGLERGDDSFRATLNGYSLNFGADRWIENPAMPRPEGVKDEDQYPIEGPLFGRAFQQGTDDWLFVTVSPESAIENFFRIKLDGENALLEGRFSFDEKPITEKAMIKK